MIQGDDASHETPNPVDSKQPIHIFIITLTEEQNKLRIKWPNVRVHYS